MASNNKSESDLIIYLVTRFMNGEITYTELKDLEDWKSQNEKNKQLFEQMVNEKHGAAAVKKMQGYDTEGKLTQVKTMLQHNRKGDANRQQRLSSNVLWQRIIAAASILALLGFLLFSYYKRKEGDISDGNKIAIIDVSPGTNKAMLILQNGRRILLSDSLKGTIAIDNDVAIKKTAEGQITYETNKTAEVASATNQIETPTGGQFQVILPDGTRVWLNAASSLKYPTAFSGQLRKVELTGEAYFEVAHNKAMPFLVKTANQQVEVLGTKFNINSYANESSTKTSLLEGSVRIMLPQQRVEKLNSVILKPGQQATQRSESIVVQLADLETVIAWKNGMLEFKDAPIDDIMRQVSRWYNLDIVYEGKIPKDLFTGGISRKSNLNNLLKIFRMSRINFRLEEGAARKTLVIIDQKKN